jgi:predicted dinucleotide-binding enzyme
VRPPSRGNLPKLPHRAKQKVSQFVADGGLRPLDVGPLRRAQQLEQLGFLHISLQQPLGLNFGNAVKLVP